MFSDQIRRLAKFSLAGNTVKYCKPVFLCKVTIITCFSKMFASSLLQLYPVILRKNIYQHFCNSRNLGSTEIQDLILQILLAVIFLLASKRMLIWISPSELRIIALYTFSIWVEVLGFKSPFCHWLSLGLKYILKPARLLNQGLRDGSSSLKKWKVQRWKFFSCST